MLCVDDFLFVLKSLYHGDDALKIARDLVKKTPKQASIDAYHAAIGEICRQYDKN